MLLKITPETYEEVEEFIASYKSDDLVPFSCCKCSSRGERKKFRIRAMIKHNKSAYCTTLCANSTEKIKAVCLECEVEVVRTFSQVVSSGNIFCTRSCAASYNNRVKPKRERGYHYVDGVKVKSNTEYKSSEKTICVCGNSKLRTSKTCSDCRLTSMKEEAEQRFLSMTFGDFKQKYPGNSTRYYNEIRVGARRLAARRGMEKICKVCNYDVYVELCHIRNISDFPDETTMEEIHAESNLVYLCPNHHKELDLGHLTL